ncbi:MAG: hypothetical protein QF921_11190 [Pseudomonadales bacterium]|nr:hypothetical protein [Pseudomonadales bacterium]MDP6470094.1 hypothetical protein [Pseudomonadales bacterium]MDP6826997.1 hypothetical protein [Pseudomonadales bacterium]MDP6972055.1 hypothetical protein [Pseudomonadales bacterium]
MSQMQTWIRHAAIAYALLVGCAQAAEPLRPVPTLSPEIREDLARLHSLANANQVEAALRDALPLVSDASTILEHAHVHSMIGYLYYRHDQLQSSVNHYERVLEHGDAVPASLRLPTLYALAQIEYLREDYAAAVAYMQQWLTLGDSETAAPLIFLAQLYFRIDDHEAAIRHLESGIALSNPAQIEEQWWQLLAYLYAEQESWGDLAEVLEIMTRDFPNPDYEARLADARRRLSDG